MEADLHRGDLQGEAPDVGCGVEATPGSLGPGSRLENVVGGAIILLPGLFFR